jgi:predicted transcriptional regulator
MPDLTNIPDRHEDDHLEAKTAKKHLQTLVAIGMITPEGGNKNRTYSITLQTD